MLLTAVRTGMVLIPLWQRQNSTNQCHHCLCSQIVKKKIINVTGLSLYCRDFGLQAEKCSVCPITEELEVLKKLMAGLLDIKLIEEVRGEGGGCWSQPRCFNSQHLLIRSETVTLEKHT